MTNKEKYAKELLNVACAGNRIAIDKRTMQIRGCANLPCGNCLFSNCGNCDTKLAEWAESEYIEKPVISKKDRAFLKYLKEEYKFVAKDENGIVQKGLKQIFESFSGDTPVYLHLIDSGKMIKVERCFWVDGKNAGVYQALDDLLGENWYLKG